MANVDLHHHSRYSKSSPEWLIRQIGIQESYTELDEVYAQAKGRGMDFVTVTDHDSIEGALRLNEKYPDDTFVSVEVTTRFPEDGCKIHLLVYGLNEKQFAEISKLRYDIYALREFVQEQSIAHSVAHATYAMDGKLDLDKVEQLILLFDVFEAINGSRNRHHNEIWAKALSVLTPERIDRLYKKHRIEPYGDDPWIKGYTAGSDDHAGLYIGSTYTIGDGSSPKAFLESLKAKQTRYSGEHGNYKKMAFSLYKISYDYARNRGTPDDKSGLISIVNRALFEGKQLAVSERFYLHRLRSNEDAKIRMLAVCLGDLLKDISGSKNRSPDKTLDLIHTRLSQFVDEYFRYILDSFVNGVSNGDMVEVAKKLSSLTTSAFLCAPFLATSRILFASNSFVYDIERNYVGESSAASKQVLWFTDTIDDLNGVSVTLKNMLRCAVGYDVALNLVISGQGIDEHDLLANIIELPCVYSYTSDLYSAFSMHFPSLLRSLKIIHDYNPHKIIVSTPGPVGILGLIAARLFGVKCIGIYHTDFKVQFDHLVGGGMTPAMIERYCNWFYMQMDEIRVPTREYMTILAERNYDQRKMRLLNRGLDIKQFYYDKEQKTMVKQRFGIQDGFTLVWAGRVSKDKNLDYLSFVYRRVVAANPDINLVIVGDGPYSEEFRHSLEDLPRVVFTGRQAHTEMRGLYSTADLFVFPSDMDTFGMVIFEAYACGLPALVTDVGGPQELIGSGGGVGEILSLENEHLWVEAILRYHDKWSSSPQEYEQMRQTLMESMQDRHSLEQALGDILDIPVTKLQHRPMPMEDRAA